MGRLESLLLVSAHPILSVSDFLWMSMGNSSISQFTPHRLAALIYHVHVQACRPEVLYILIFLRFSLTTNSRLYHMCKPVCAAYRAGGGRSVEARRFVGVFADLTVQLSVVFKNAHLSYLPHTRESRKASTTHLSTLILLRAPRTS